MEAVSYKVPVSLIEAIDNLGEIVHVKRSQMLRHCLVVGLAALQAAHNCPSCDAVSQFIATQKPAKLPAPAGETYTSPKHWRGHIRTLYSELVDHFGQEVFRIRELRRFLEDRVELLPFDLSPRDGHSGQQNLMWHKAIHDGIDVKPQTWGEGGALIVYVSRDRWRMVI